MEQLQVGEQVARVDQADYGVVNAYRWHIERGGKNRYAVTRIDGKRVSMHRLIMGAATGTVVDHINGDGLDNRRANLRFCSRKQNFQNGRWRDTPGRTSRYKGVWLERGSCHRCWRSAITADMVRRNLGSFATELEAARAYDAAALRLHGAFARINFPAGEVAAA